VNGKLTLDNFDITAQYGAATAVQKTTRVNVRGNAGIKIDFKAIESVPVLNAIQIRRIDNNEQPVTAGK
jgi:hypothetical protein